jgi:hypothetical protein
VWPRGHMDGNIMASDFEEEVLSLSFFSLPF